MPTGKLHNISMELLSHVYCRDGAEYLIVQYKRGSYETVRYYTIHLCNVSLKMLETEPLIEVYMPYTQKKRYELYTKEFISILAYALSSGKLIPNKKPPRKKVTISFKQLDKLYEDMVKEYKNGTFDSNSIMEFDI